MNKQNSFLYEQESKLSENMVPLPCEIKEVSMPQQFQSHLMEAKSQKQETQEVKPFKLSREDALLVKKSLVSLFNATTKTIRFSNTYKSLNDVTQLLLFKVEMSKQKVNMMVSEKQGSMLKTFNYQIEQASLMVNQQPCSQEDMYFFTHYLSKLLADVADKRIACELR